MKISSQIIGIVLLLLVTSASVAAASPGAEQLSEAGFIAENSFATAYQASNTQIAGQKNCACNNCRIYLRANLLRWATLTPDLGIEWRATDRWAVLLNGSYTSWGWDSKNRRYALWEVAPEVRCYLGKKRNWYVGVMYKVGEFNYKFSEFGKEGDIMGGGITAGYLLKANKHLSIDFGVGIGYMHAKYERYNVIDNVRVRQGRDSRNWYGPVSAGITLVWNPF